MAVPTILTSDDAGAPTLNGTDGSLIDVLDWALVDSANALGWTKPFTNTATKGVWRNNSGTGTGVYLRAIDAAASHSADARRVSLQTYVTMSDIDNGTGLSPSSGERYWIKSQDLDSSAKDWVIIGTDKQFYFWRWIDQITSDNEGYFWGFFGDFRSYMLADPHNACAVWDDSTSTSSTDTISYNSILFSGTPSTTNNISLSGLMVSADGGSNSRDIVLTSASDPGTTSSGLPPGSGGSYPSQTGAIDVSRVNIYDFSDTLASRFYRGYLPGLYNPLVSLKLGDQSDYTAPLDDVAGINNGTSVVTMKYMPVNGRFDFNSDSLSGAFLIDTTSDWDTI